MSRRRRHGMSLPSGWTDELAHWRTASQLDEIVLVPSEPQKGPVEGREGTSGWNDPMSTPLSDLRAAVERACLDPDWDGRLPSRSTDEQNLIDRLNARLSQAQVDHDCARLH